MTTLDDLPGIPTQREALTNRAREAARRQRSSVNAGSAATISSATTNEAKDAALASITSATGRQLERRGEKVIEKLTVDQAAEEIKRLRREVRISRVETARKDSMVEETRNELKSLQESSILLKEARKLTYKALRKGRALQSLGHILSNNSLNFQLVKEAYQAFVRYTFGAAHLAYRGRHGHTPGVQAYTDSHLRLFRQEQLILLAENERLVNEVKSLREDMSSSHVSGERKAEAAKLQKLLLSPHALCAGQDSSSGVGRSATPTANYSARRSSTPTASEAMAASASSASAASGSDESSDVVELDPDVVYRHFQGCSVIIASARLRLMASTFRKLLCRLHFLRGVEHSRGQARTSSYLRHYLLVQQLHMLFKSHRSFLVSTAFWKIAGRAKVQIRDLTRCRACESYHDRFIVGKNQGNLGTRGTFGGPFMSVTPSPSPPYSSFPIYPSAVQGAGPTGAGFGFACKPHYFEKLPSTQHRTPHNVYFASRALDEERKPVGTHPNPNLQSSLRSYAVSPFEKGDVAGRAETAARYPPTLYRATGGTDGWGNPYTGKGLGVTGGWGDGIGGGGRSSSAPPTRDDGAGEAKRFDLEAEEKNIQETLRTRVPYPDQIYSKSKFPNRNKPFLAETEAKQVYYDLLTQAMDETNL